MKSDDRGRGMSSDEPVRDGKRRGQAAGIGRVERPGRRNHVLARAQQALEQRPVAGDEREEQRIALAFGGAVAMLVDRIDDPAVVTDEGLHEGIELRPRTQRSRACRHRRPRSPRSPCLRKQQRPGSRHRSRP